MTRKHIPYFRFYPSDFMNGVRGLTAQEVGVYTMILCRIYEDGGPIELHLKRLSTYCGMREKTFETVINNLIDLGKLDLENGMISNSRAEAEISSRANDLKNSSKAGKASAQKRQQNQRNSSTTVERPFNHTDTDTYKGNSLRSLPISDEIKKSKNGSRIPDDFKPDREWSLKQGLSVQELRFEFEQFKDYWSAKTGKDATKKDWQATWRQWIRNTVKRKTGLGKPKTVGEGFVELAKDMGVLRNDEQSDAQAGLFETGDAERHGPVLELAINPTEPERDRPNDFASRLLHRP